MRIEGFFTKEEITSALALGATPTKLTFRRLQLSFPSQAAFDTWFARQQEQQSNNWGTMMSIKPKLPSARQ